MVRAGIHPMRHLVRHVLPDGSSVFTQMAWLRPYPGLDITTVFHDVNNFKPNPGERKAPVKNIGQRARFENRFGGESNLPIDTTDKN